MRIKRDKLDDVFSRLIRTRDHWTCQCCTKVYPENSQGLHCSHFVGRRHLATRFYPGNAVAHCYSCHQRLGANPLEFAEWIRDYLGDARYQILLTRSRTIEKLPKHYRELIYQHYKRELVRANECRDRALPFVIVDYREALS